MTKAAEKIPDADTSEVTTRKEPAVNTKCVWRQRGGSRWCEWACVFPEGAGVEYLDEPGIWWRVQQDRQRAFKSGDEVRIAAFDSSWIAHCIVAHASLTEVQLATVTVTKMPARREFLFEDATYAVRFVGNGYQVFRKRDNQAMSPAVHSSDAAQSVLVGLYPQVV